MNRTRGSAAPASGTATNPEIPTFDELAADPDIAALLDIEPVVRKVKRPDGWTDALQRELIARIAATGTLQQAVWQMGKHATGAEALYKTPHADSFRASWDDAIALGRRRNHLDSAAPYAGEVPGIQRRRSAVPSGPLDAAGQPQQPGQVLNEHGEWEDDESYRQRAEDAQESIAMKLLRIRRLFLKQISASPGKRAAFEILTELPVDWDLAERCEPQPDEPWNRAAQRQPDMVLTAESGWSFGEIGYGPDRKAEARHAIDAHRASEGLDPVQWDDL